MVDFRNFAPEYRSFHGIYTLHRNTSLRPPMIIDNPPFLCIRSNRRIKNRGPSNSHPSVGNSRTATGSKLSEIMDKWIARLIQSQGQGHDVQHLVTWRRKVKAKVPTYYAGQTMHVREAGWWSSLRELILFRFLVREADLFQSRALSGFRFGCNCKSVLGGDLHRRTQTSHIVQIHTTHHW